MKVLFPYGREKLSYDFKDEEIRAVLTSSLEEYEPVCCEIELVRRAIENP